MSRSFQKVPYKDILLLIITERAMSILISLQRFLANVFSKLLKVITDALIFYPVIGMRNRIDNVTQNAEIRSVC